MDQGEAAFLPNRKRPSLHSGVVLRVNSWFCPQVNHTPDSCQETKFKVINLDEGALYRFRVMAVNAAGESDPTNLKEPIRAQDRLGAPSAIVVLLVFVVLLFSFILFLTNLFAVYRAPRADPGRGNDPRGEGHGRNSHQPDGHNQGCSLPRRHMEEERS